MTYISEIIETIDTREKLAKFIYELHQDFQNNPDEWESSNLSDYLESMSAWVNDMDGHFMNTDEKIPQNIPWGFFASIIYAAKVYE